MDPFLLFSKYFNILLSFFVSHLSLSRIPITYLVLLTNKPPLNMYVAPTL